MPSANVAVTVTVVRRRCRHKRDRRNQGAIGNPRRRHAAPPSAPSPHHRYTSPASPPDPPAPPAHTARDANVTVRRLRRRRITRPPRRRQRTHPGEPRVDNVAVTVTVPRPSATPRLIEYMTPATIGANVTVALRRHPTTHTRPAPPSDHHRRRPACTTPPATADREHRRRRRRVPAHPVGNGPTHFTPGGQRRRHRHRGHLPTCHGPAGTSV